VKVGDLETAGPFVKCFFLFLKGRGGGGGGGGGAGLLGFVQVV